MSSQAKRACNGRTAGALALAALGHLALLAALGSAVPGLGFRAAPDGPVLEVSLVRRPARAAPSSTRPPSSHLAAAAARAAPDPGLPLRAAPAPAQAALPVPAAPSGEPALDCSRETFLLLTPQEQRACRVRGATAAAAQGRGLAGGTGERAYSAIDPALRADFDGQVAARAGDRDVARGQADIAAIQAARPPGVGAQFDVNIRIGCSVKFGGAVRMRCGIGPPSRISGK
jgi:hypothetical protein